MRELAGTITEFCGSESTLEFWPLPTNNPRQCRPDMAKAPELLGWQPTIAPAAELKPIIEYFRRFEQ